MGLKTIDREVIDDLLEAHIQLLKGGRGRWAEISNANLSGFDFRGRDLRFVKFYNVILTGANFENADLRDATLKLVEASGANFRNADLCGVNFSMSQLNDADIRGARILFVTFPSMEFCRRIKVDRSQAARFIYHLCDLDGDDADFISLREELQDFASTYRKVSSRQQEKGNV